MEDYLIYATTSVGLLVYHIKTNDIFHAIGEIYYLSAVEIFRIVYVKDSVEYRDFWKQNGYSIQEWHSRY